MCCYESSWCHFRQRIHVENGTSYPFPTKSALGALLNILSFLLTEIIANLRIKLSEMFNCSIFVWLSFISDRTDILKGFFTNKILLGRNTNFLLLIICFGSHVNQHTRFRATHPKMTESIAAESIDLYRNEFAHEVWIEEL